VPRKRTALSTRKPRRTAALHSGKYIVTWDTDADTGGRGVHAKLKTLIGISL
jgi:hypothetical protein